MTAPWRPDTDRLVGQGVGHVATARALLPDGGDLALALDPATWWGYDRRRAPRLAGRLVCAVPERQADLDALDPRRLVRVELSAGYVRPGGARDVHVTGRPLVTDRRLTRRPRRQDVLELEVASDEQLVIDNRALAPYTPAQTTAAGAAQQLVAAALPYAPTWNGTPPPGAPAEPVTLPAGGDYWAMAEDLVDQVAADLWHDGLDDGGWWLDRLPALAGASAAVLRVGTGGTITAAGAGLSRRGGPTGWANAVSLAYRWTDDAGVDHEVNGAAWASAGPFTPAAAGRVVYAERRDVPTTAGGANAAATAILLRRLARGRTVTLSAVARYWLRPGHTVTVQLPGAAQERLLVAAVTFRPHQGLMDLDVELPDDATTITTGG